MAGSPFFVIKADGKQVDQESIQETANATCSFSRAFKLGLATSDVFWVEPSQLSKTPKSGEYLTKGSFIVSGKSNYVKNEINVAIGVMEDGKVMCAPKSAIAVHCKSFLVVKQGSLKPSDTAKKIRKELGGELDDIIKALPSGNMEIEKSRMKGR